MKEGGLLRKTAVLKGYQFLTAGILNQVSILFNPAMSAQWCREKRKVFLKSERTRLLHRALSRLIWTLLELAGKARQTDPFSPAEGLYQS